MRWWLLAATLAFERKAKNWPTPLYSGAFLPDSAQLYDVQTSWRLDDGEWTLYHVRWTPAL